MTITLNGTTGITSTGITETSDGNVGIGTSSPSVPVSGVGLHLSDTSANTGIRLQDTAFANKDFTIRLDATDNALAIYHQNSASEKMRIDSAGRVTMPYQPAFRVHRSTATWEVYSLQTVIWDTATLNIGNHFNTTNGTFTAPINGLYYLQFAAYQLQASAYGSAYIYVNGLTDNTYRYCLVQENTALDMTNHVIVIQPLLAGDSVTTVVSGDLYTGHSSFSGYLIG